MSIIIETVIKAGDHPPEPRGDLYTEVEVSVCRFTENGFTEAFEAEVIKADQDVEGVPFRTEKAVIEELGTVATDEA
jgi:hypothetical protein